jgi:alkanesulfonate monooxygenase SsuD/methylene tetrahydromethanopterin reductase-like flavin-dependent oxidoreductase (luciferase family)
MADVRPKAEAEVETIAARPRVTFGWVAAAAGRPGAGDDELYADLLDDCSANHALGYEAAWVLEHHFSDYFPTPDPLLLLA